MAIYSRKHAKALKADSMRIDPTYQSPTGVRVCATLEGESKARTFHVNDLIADDGRKEILNAIAALRSSAEVVSVDSVTALRYE